MKIVQKKEKYDLIQKMYDEADTIEIETNMVPLNRHISPLGKELLSDIQGLLNMCEHHDYIEEYLQNAISYISFCVLELQEKASKWES